MDSSETTTTAPPSQTQELTLVLPVQTQNSSNNNSSINNLSINNGNNVSEEILNDKGKNSYDINIY